MIETDVPGTQRLVPAPIVPLAVVAAVGRRTPLLPRVDAVDDPDAVEAAR